MQNYCGPISRQGFAGIAWSCLIMLDHWFSGFHDGLGPCWFLKIVEANSIHQHTTYLWIQPRYNRIERGQWKLCLRFIPFFHVALEPPETVIQGCTAQCAWLFCTALWKTRETHTANTLFSFSLMMFDAMNWADRTWSAQPQTFDSVNSECRGRRIKLLSFRDKGDSCGEAHMPMG